MQNKNPAHIAIILDGNRRYAGKKGLSPWEGHKYGAEKIKELLEWCREFGIKELTLYTFSMDNFNRPEKEKKALFTLFQQNIKKLKNNKKLDKHGINIGFIGRLHMFPKAMQEEMNSVMEKTKKNDKFRLNFAMAYGGRAEITDALKSIIKKIRNKEIDEKDVDENSINESLYISSTPDILIRPGGEKRVSDFLLWQSAYTELMFLDKLWPEFTKNDFIECIEEFKKRERRFGR